MPEDDLFEEDWDAVFTTPEEPTDLPEFDCATDGLCDIPEAKETPDSADSESCEEVCG